MKESVIIIDQNDRMLGTMDKMAAHFGGILHRAFSIFIFNSKGELLMQQRAFGKYHSGGLWTNTCCSHPRLGESTPDAAYRRLKEEMGISCLLDTVFTFSYKATLTATITENEFDHVFFGLSDEVPFPDSAEVNAFKYMSLITLKQELIDHPDDYTQWLNICFEQVMENYIKLTVFSE